MAKLYFYYSAMNAGKTTVLLQSAHNYRERGMFPLLFKPRFDDRYSEGLIRSRIGLESPSPRRILFRSCALSTSLFGMLMVETRESPGSMVTGSLSTSEGSNQFRTPLS